ncbi:MAG TPA: VOC family protein [Pyrinomonadaceae bacterium]|jgi:predicted enzyme related to lactoylglutathione lyase|nr:VOC family protein [Pyrinomonadaceae bacterium]
MNLNQVTIFSSKTVELVEFYQKLGLRLIVDSLPRYARMECPDGDSTLSVHFTDVSHTDSNVVLYFECEDLDARVAQLKEQGLKFEEEPKDQDWLWREAYLRDPSNNRICLFYAGENRKDPPWKVK